MGVADLVSSASCEVYCTELMGNCCKTAGEAAMRSSGISFFTLSSTARIVVREPGPVVNLTAVQEANSGSVTLRWVPPLEYGDDVTSYDVRFKPVGAAHYTYAAPIGMHSVIAATQVAVLSV